MIEDVSRALPTARSREAIGTAHERALGDRAERLDPGRETATVSRSGGLIRTG